ncbi:MAG: transporter substrate-binding domain-containing protein [Candidatus Staskawiczbacteria bacterium]
MLHFELQTWFGRSLAVLLQLTNLAVLGLFIGELTAFITTKKVRLNIEGPEDLKGKNVATVKGTTTEPVLKNLGANIFPVTKIEDAYNKLKKNEVEAVVFDAPVLTYYALNGGIGWAEVVGKLFEEQDYGIVFQEKGKLREKINRAILTVRENGFYDALYKKYFGTVE